VKIGFIGLGHMGRAMARRLLAAGHELTVNNRSVEKTKPLADAGARIARTPAEAAASAEVVITMLADDPAVASAVLQETGVVAGLARGNIHLSMSTISPEMSSRVASTHRDVGQLYIAAPVLGRPDAAERGELAIVAAGPSDAIERCRPIFDALGREMHVIAEEPQQANVVKLAANLLFAVIIEALGESFEFVERYGIDARRFLDLVNGASIKSPMVAAYGPRIADRQFEPAGFRLALGAKDIGLVLDAAARRAVEMPVAKLLHDRFLEAMAEGFGELDWSAVGRVLGHARHEGSATETAPQH
jgi:3-hydroxyisobutyrate dehydrogenase-like beta-hydroxyacid dehydrogenase